MNFSELRERGCESGRLWHWIPFNGSECAALVRSSHPVNRSDRVARSRGWFAAMRGNVYFHWKGCVGYPQPQPGGLGIEMNEPTHSSKRTDCGPGFRDLQMRGRGYFLRSGNNRWVSCSIGGDLLVPWKVDSVRGFGGLIGKGLEVFRLADGGFGGLREGWKRCIGRRGVPGVERVSILGAQTSGCEGPVNFWLHGT